jgi:hypothetical protein
MNVKRMAIFATMVTMIAAIVAMPAALAASDATLRIYGEDGLSAAFPYTHPEAPFDPQSDEAPEKDFVVFNPAYIPFPGITASNIDSKMKVFARQWFVPELVEPVGDVWISDPNDYVSEDVVTEYTYMFIDKHDNPTYGTALSPDGSYWTKFWMPVADNDDNQTGIDGCDINGDGADDWIVLRDVGYYPGLSGAVDNRKDINISSETFGLIAGEEITFLDHKVVVKNVAKTVDLVVDVYYLGNDDPELIGQNIVVPETPGSYVRAGRHVVSEGAPIFAEPWYLYTENTIGGTAYVQVGRLLHTSETFFVDGAEYDVAMIYGPTNTSLKYITIRNPVPEHSDVNLEDLSVIKECVQDGELMPLLPPFNRVHEMIDDINIPDDESSICTAYFPDNIGSVDDGATFGGDDHLMNKYDTVQDRRIKNVPALDIYFTHKDIEPRFNTNLLEILDESTFVEPTPIDVILAIDSSGSMDWNDPADERLAAAKAFVDLLDDTRDQVGVVSWDNDIDFTVALTNDFDTVRTKIDTVDHDGGTNLDVGLDASIDLLDASARESVKVIIFLSNGVGAYTPCGGGGPIDEAKDNDYVVYAIGLVSNAAHLEDMATCTGGDYYEDATPATLQEIYEDIFDEILIIEESWKWLDIHTMPDFYKEFVYPELPDCDDGTGDFLLVSSWRAPNSCDARVMFAYDQATGDQDIYINNYPDYNALRLYGEDETYDAAFPYTDPEAPFDPLSLEAPGKDFVTFNPAVVRMSGIVVSDVDSKMKVFARQWFIPEYLEPVGDVWLDNPNIYESEDVITEYTYMFIDKHYMPTYGTALSPGGSYWTKFWLPVTDNDDAQIGIDGCDINNDGIDDWVILRGVGLFNPDPRKDINISSETFELYQDEELTFLDHKMVVKNVEVISGAPPLINMVVDIYYLGNAAPELIEQNFMAQIVPGEYVRAGRHTANNAPPDFYEPWYIKAIATGGDRAYVQVGRLLHTNETFFVDGAEYDVAMIYGPTGDSLKYITIRNPVPEHVDIDLEDLSVIKECVMDGELMPLLPPFNMVHEMVDDISIPDSVDDPCPIYYPYGDEILPAYDTVEERIISGVPALDIYFTHKDIEPRFNTNLLEILDEGCIESWQWLDIHTMPDFYKEFVYPELPDIDNGAGDWLVTSSFTAPNSCDARVMFAYDAADGTVLYMNKPHDGGPPLTACDYYDALENGGNGDGVVDKPEATNAMWDYLFDGGPFGGDGTFEKQDAIDLMWAYLFGGWCS